MHGVRVQPWAMRYFTAAMLCLALAELVEIAGLTYPARSLFAPTTLVAVHLTTIGWMTLLMLGALHQFVPVITNHQLASDQAPATSLTIILIGLGFMLFGFLNLPGGLLALPLGDLGLPIGGSIVIIGALISIVNLAITLWRSRPLGLPSLYVSVALGFFLVTLAMGTSLALLLTDPGVLSPGFLTILANGLPLHLLAGIGGWFTLIALGVGIKLLSMFSLAPEERGLPGHLAFYLTTVGMSVAWLANVVGTALGSVAWLSGTSDIGWLSTAVGVGIYLVDMVDMYHHRRRKELELNASMAPLALGMFGGAMILGAIVWVFGLWDRGAPAVIYLLLYGWLGGLGLTQLFKIVPFLTWLERYGRRLGRGAVPRVQDLVNEPEARPAYLLYFAAVGASTVAVWFGSEIAFQLTTAAVFLGTLGVARTLYRVRHPLKEPEPRQAGPRERLGMIAR